MMKKGKLTCFFVLSASEVHLFSPFSKITPFDQFFFYCETLLCRELYDDLLNKQKEKVRLRNSKSEHFHSPQLKEAHDEYDEEANVFVFRMKSLKQGQSRSFLTQASRHHAAQVVLFAAL